jgi:hypothetical protein
MEVRDIKLSKKSFYQCVGSYATTHGSSLPGGFIVPPLLPPCADDKDHHYL